MKHNIGLVGCGNWGQVIIKEIIKNKNFTLKGIVCKSNIKLIKNSKIKIYDNYESLISDKNISCLYIAKDPEINFLIFKNLKKDIPIIFEKPITKNFKQALMIYNLSLKKNICMMTNLPNIYSDTFNETKNFIEKNIKNIHKIKIIDGNYGPFRKEIHPVLDWGIHPLTYIIKIFGSKQIVKISHKFLKKNFKTNTFISKFDFQNKNNIDISISTGNIFKKKIRLLKIFLKDGEIFTNNFVTHEISYKNKMIFKSNETPIQNLLNKFANNIENKKNDADIENLLISAESIKIINTNIKKS